MLLKEAHNNDFSSKLSKIYSTLSQNVRADLNNYINKMKDLNLEKQNLQDECR